MAEILPDDIDLEQLRTALENPYFSSYAYIGGGNDKAWRIARRIQEYVPALRVYLIRTNAADGFRDEYDVPNNRRAVVFGFGTEVYSRLTKTRAEDALFVLEEIRDARA